MVGRASGKERGMKKQKSPGDRIFISMVYVLMGLMGLICLYPMWHVVMASFSDPLELMRHTGVILKPLGFSLEGYRVVIENPNILPSYFNTIVYVLVGTAINMFLTILGAYALSRKGFMLKRPLTLLIVFTMYFNAGLIPNFLLVKGLGLYNTIWALVLPGAISTWNLIVMKTSFQSIPVSLEESARLDGANDFVILFKIILPLSKATMAVMVLFYAVAHWSSWFNAMIYLRACHAGDSDCQFIRRKQHDGYGCDVPGGNRKIFHNCGCDGPDSVYLSVCAEILYVGCDDGVCKRVKEGKRG